MISLIAAIGKNGELGKKNDLIWQLPGDLEFFKQTTLNHPIIMGYNTYLSIGRPLPKRRNIVIVNDKNLLNDANLIIYDNMNELEKNEINEEEVFVIGGASLYNYFYNKADKMYLTLIDAEDKEAEVYFPNIDYSKWKQTELMKKEDNGIKYRHVLFERI